MSTCKQVKIESFALLLTFELSQMLKILFQTLNTFSKRLLLTINKGKKTLSDVLLNSQM